MVVKQTQFITKLLERFGQVSAHGVRNPMVIGQDLSPSDKHGVCTDKNKYRELIGSMLYVANATRPDIGYVLSILSQYLDTPRDMHWNAALRVLRYLKATDSIGIHDTAKGKNIVTYCDANWGGDKETRRSTSGVMVKKADGPIIYKSKRQATVALSTAEAEYMALALTAQEVLWLRFLLTEMGENVSSASTIYMDNQSAISMATNHGYTPRAKHIDLRAHYVRDHVEKGTVKVEYVPSESQLADMLTKAIPTPRFVELRDACGLVDCQVKGECNGL